MGLFGPPNVARLEAKRDVNGLIKALSYEKELHVRRGAAEALGRLGDPRAVEPLIFALRDKDSLLCESATEALVKIGKPAVEPLLFALRDRDSLLHRKGEDWDVRQKATEALVKIGEPAVEPLIHALRSRDSFIPVSATEALGRIGDPRAVEPLISYLMCDGAAKALVNIGEPAVEPLISVLRNEYSDVRKKAAVALHEIGWEPDTSENKVLYYIASGNWDSCIKMGAIAVEPLISALRDKDRNVRKGAAEALGRIGEPAVKPLLFALRDRDSLLYQEGEYLDVRRCATEALVKVGKPAVEPLISALRDKDSDVRSYAAVALHEIGWEPDTSENKVLYYIASGNWDSCIKMGAIAVEPLISALRDKDWNVRKGAAEALGRIGEPRAVEPLISAFLKDEDWQVRWWAAEALGAIGDPRAVKPLIDMLQRDSPELCAVAAAALAILYHNDKLDIASKQRILSIRDTAIARRHVDYGPLGCHSDYGNKHLKF